MYVLTLTSLLCYYLPYFERNFDILSYIIVRQHIDRAAKILVVAALIHTRTTGGMPKRTELARNRFRTAKRSSGKLPPQRSIFTEQNHRTIGDGPLNVDP
ncbi:hypothetical protein TNCV_895201 [Trichonephila clavipes]|nr:hypothetical protein TNCV_895201 [Trichonephila clavipes]